MLTCRYIRLIVNEFPGWPVLRMELYAPEHKRFRLGAPLGLSNGVIPDSALSASSAHGNNWNYYGPRNARLDGGGSYGSYIPAVNRNGEWVQVDLGRTREVGGIATQGRKWGGCWWKSYTVLYSNDANNWSPYMAGGVTATILANKDGNSRVNNILTPFVARYVRLTVTDFYNWPCLRFEVYAPHPSRMNQGKLESIGEPLGMETGKISDAKLLASSFYVTNDQACHPRNGRLRGSSGAGAWCSQSNDPNSWFQIELDPSIEVGGIATQGRNVNSDLYKGASQWVTSYTLSYSNDQTTWTPVKSEDGTPQMFIGNVDSSTVVKNALQPPVSAKYLRIHPQGWLGHISMRVELYDTAARQAKLAADQAAAAAAEAERAAMEKASLARKQAEEQAAREAAEAAAKKAEVEAAIAKREADRKVQEAQNAADKQAAEAAAASAAATLAAAKKRADELQVQSENEAAAAAAALQAVQDKVTALQSQVEAEKFDEEQYRQTQKAIATVEQDIADEETRALKAQAVWQERLARDDAEKRKVELLEQRLAQVEKDIQTENEKVDEDKAAKQAVAITVMQADPAASAKPQ